jgi:hypothetical protein
MVQKNPLILSLVFHGNDILKDSVPSWVHNFSHQLGSGGYSSLLGSHPNYATGSIGGTKMTVVVTDTTLRLRGILFDCVVEYTNELWYAYFEKLGEANPVAEVLNFVRRIAKATSYNFMNPEKLAALIMTAAGISTDEKKYLMNFHSYCDHVNYQSSRNRRGGGAYDTFMRRAGFSHCRRVFSTRTGYLGLGPSAMEEGDVVVVFFSFLVPFIIRKIDDHYLLVGEAYAYGIMKGEVLKGDMEEVDFEIH